MKLKNYSIEDLEQMTYCEIAEIILNEKNDKMKVVDIFKKICKSLNLDEGEFENHIADFFELISTDSRFIVLEKGYCDLRKKHAPKVIIEDEEDDEEIIIDEDDDILDEEKDDEENYYEDSSEEDDLDDGDDLDDFMVIEDEEEPGI